MNYLSGLLLTLLPLSVFAQVPQQFELVYRFTFNGQYVGNVTDRFQRLGSQQYQLTSVAKPDGKLSLLLPTLTLTSKARTSHNSLFPPPIARCAAMRPKKPRRPASTGPKSC